MPIIYSIQPTDLNETPFIIKPSQIDGAGGPQSNSSLILHGTGRLEYGKALNENFLHLLENFASPARPLPIVANISSAANSGSVGTHYIEVNGNVSNVFINGFTFDIVSSTGGINNGTYTADSSTYFGGTDATQIIIQESLPDDSLTTIGFVSYSSIEPDPLMVKPPYNIGQLWFNKTNNNLYVFKDIDGLGTHQWENSSSSVTNSTTPPQFPENGDLWFDVNIPQLFVYHLGSWVSVADNYVLKSGDTMDLSAVLDFGGQLFINLGASDDTIAPDLRSISNLSLSSVGSSIITIDDNNSGTGSFFIKKGNISTSSSSDVLVIDNSGLMTTGIPSYETLLSANNDIPNKKYVDDEIATLSSTLTSSYLPLAGGEMVGDLEIEAPAIGVDSHRIIFKSNTTDDSAIYKHESAFDLSELRISISDNNDNDGDILSVGSDTGTLWVERFRFDNSGNLHITGNATVGSSLASSITTANQLTNKAYVDDELSTLQLVPVGTTIPFSGLTVPSGYVECDGAELDRIIYADLFAVIGTTYGIGNGSTTFNLPDMRGVFLRGYDNGRGIDAGRIYGSYQDDELKSHTHTYRTHWGTGSAGPVSLDDRMPIQTLTTGATGGSETRPKNINMLYIIKY